ncbi:hypothetical protein E2C01_055389 [Portunus trituberculatus]|uniref:Uncharacterized protein n=1 Tax=Portunus trituberculatus TaxID=210409 RepID=A0A5B7GUV1_PORTR|nr:hypothetical protein [Portunus trituberculatus]
MFLRVLIAGDATRPARNHHEMGRQGVWDLTTSRPPDASSLGATDSHGKTAQTDFKTRGPTYQETLYGARRYQTVW